MTETETMAEAAQPTPPDPGNWVPEVMARFGAERVVAPKWPKHPLLPRLPWRVAQRLLREGGLRKLNEVVSRINARLQLEHDNPLEWGFEWASWKLCDVLWGWLTWREFCAEPEVPEEWKVPVIEDLAGERRKIGLMLGGWRSAKTEYMCKRVVQCAVKYQDSRMWVLHTNHDMSVEYHHRGVYKYLPPEYQDLKRSKFGDVSYSQKNGFTVDKLVFPNPDGGPGSVIEFKTYEQYEKQTAAFEGAELGARGCEPCLGYVADELIPYQAWEALRSRLVTREGVGLTGFYPKDGYTEVVGTFNDGATELLDDVVEGVLNPLGQPARAPLVLRSQEKKRFVVHFFSKRNPFGNYPALLAEYATDAYETKLARFAGKAWKMRDAMFPRFSEKVQVVEAESIPEHGTNWFVCDPAGRKNWFMLWGRVDPFDRLWIYREWPCATEHIPNVGFPGPWATVGSNKGHAHGGLPGEGSKEFGFAILDYKNEVARLEGWEDCRRGDKALEAWSDRNGAREEIHLRMMDSRFAGDPTQTHSHNTTLYEECATAGLVFDDLAPGGDIYDPGVKMINDALQYKDEWLTTAAERRKPGDGPRLFISRRCQNLIFAMKVWTHDGGAKEATKDPIDCLRYLVTYPAHYANRRERRKAAGPRTELERAMEGLRKK